MPEATMSQAKQSLFSSLKEEAVSLADDVRQMLLLHWQLARLEVLGDLKAVKRLAVMLAVACVLLLTALPLFAVSIAVDLDGRLQIATAGWLLIFGGALLLLGLIVAAVAWSRFRSRFTGLEQTLEELREDVVWLRRTLGTPRKD
jgi:hypothetical protein